MKFQGEATDRRNRALGVLEAEADRDPAPPPASTFCTAPCGSNPCRPAEDDLVVGGLHVLGGHLAAVVELHAAAELEGAGPPVTGGRPALGQAGRRLGAGGIVGIHLEERVVEGREGVGQAEGLSRCPSWWTAARRHREHQFPAPERGFSWAQAGDDQDGDHQQGQQCRDAFPSTTSPWIIC